MAGGSGSGGSGGSSDDGGFGSATASVSPGQAAAIGFAMGQATNTGVPGVSSVASPSGVGWGQQGQGSANGYGFGNPGFGLGTAPAGTSSIGPGFGQSTDAGLGGSSSGGGMAVGPADGGGAQSGYGGITGNSVAGVNAPGGIGGGFGSGLGGGTGGGIGGGTGGAGSGTGPGGFGGSGNAGSVGGGFGGSPGAATGGGHGADDAAHQNALDLMWATLNSSQMFNPNRAALLGSAGQIGVPSSLAQSFGGGTPANQALNSANQNALSLATNLGIPPGMLTNNPVYNMVINNALQILNSNQSMGYPSLGVNKFGQSADSPPGISNSGLTGFANPPSVGQIGLGGANATGFPYGLGPESNTVFGQNAIAAMDRGGNNAAVQRGIAADRGIGVPGFPYGVNNAADSTFNPNQAIFGLPGYYNPAGNAALGLAAAKGNQGQGRY